MWVENGDVIAPGDLCYRATTAKGTKKRSEERDERPLIAVYRTFSAVGPICASRGGTEIR